MTKSKLKTPDWILEGKEKPRKEKEGKTFKIRECPKCGSDDVGVALSNLDSDEESNTGKQWECRKCKWIGGNIKERALTEEELMAHLDKKGEEVA